MNKKIMAALGLSVLLASGCASTEGMQYAETNNGFAQWDRDRNGMIANDEFRAGFTQNASFNEWDTDRNGMLSDQEFGVASAEWGIGADSFGVWDANRDGMLDNNEFGIGAFSTWDHDRDGFLNDDEFGVGMGWFD
ncbi:hypothetical protein ACFFGH_00295 [Lysobacter korlensis]|uniref:EF-hand domain-containing protein n=1 Tax=Lysobacter korlensis TaxID=553636 RepID=A0ABV6RIU4_9GAMM